jgi:CheY-like chemotaxis protein
MGFSELALMNVGRDETEVRAGLSQVNKASQVAADLVDQILSVSREQPRREVPFLMQETVRDALGLLRPGLPPRIALEVSIAESCPPALGDPSRIHQVVMNLCTNAAQAIALGEGRIHIRVEHDPEVDPESAPRGWVVLRVDDDGPGMEDALVRRAFDPFFTTKETGKGTGLGLSVVHGIVMSHGGRVTLDSTPGLGTNVVVRIPVAEPRPAVRAPQPRPPLEPLSVLVVDDEAPVAAVIRKVLEADGHAVNVAADGPTALEALDDAGAFDVLITDYAMPEMNGMALAEAALERAPHLRVVLASGYLFRDPIAEDRFVRLKKPFTAAQLMTAVDRALRAD